MAKTKKPKLEVKEETSLTERLLVLETTIRALVQTLGDATYSLHGVIDLVDEVKASDALVRYDFHRQLMRALKSAYMLTVDDQWREMVFRFAKTPESMDAWAGRGQRIYRYGHQPEKRRRHEKASNASNRLIETIFGKPKKRKPKSKSKRRRR